MSGPTPGPYLLDGLTVYALQESGDRRCPLVNRWSAHVQLAPGTPVEEAEAVAVLFKAAPDLLTELREATRLMVNLQADEYGPRENWPARGQIERQEAAIAAAEPKP